MTHAMMAIHSGLWGLLFVLTVFISCSADDTPTCRDADGYYIYKLPRNKKSADPLQQQGLAYAYITSSAPQKGWTISTVGIDDQNSIPAKTLAPMYKAARTYGTTNFMFMTHSYLKNVTDIKAVIAGKDVGTGKTFNIATISSLGNSSRHSSGVKFTSYAKTKKFGKDLYADLVAQQEKVPLVVQSWRLALWPLPSACEENRRTYNVKKTSLSLKYPNSKIIPDFFSNVDHSKWAVAWNKTKSEPDKKIICVGDINRTKHQAVRGGGTVCLTHPDVWNSYFKSVVEYEKCRS